MRQAKRGISETIILEQYSNFYKYYFSSFGTDGTLG